jgi:hypothetical protein
MALAGMAASALGAATWVNGSVPDWNQPFAYNAPNGPGPNPNPNGPTQWGAWCAPTSGSNLVGHWQDARGAAVADGQAFPNSPAWPAVSWHDYNADNARPARTAPLPAVATDIGWYMDTNNLGAAVGNGNDGHMGTYIKDMHIGLANYLNTRSAGWMAKTQGRINTNVAYTTDPNNYPAVMHPNPAAAFGEIVQEINANRTAIVSWTYWKLLPSAQTLNPAGQGESNNGGTFYTWNTPPTMPGFDPDGQGEYWNNNYYGDGLGHAVTAVGYIVAGDVDDKGPALGLGPTDWVIVHDNWGSTVRNVIVPFDSPAGFNRWAATTTAVPEPSALALVAAAAVFAAGACRRWRRRQPHG